MPRLAAAVAKALYDKANPNQVLSKTEVEAACVSLRSDPQVKASLKNTWRELGAVTQQNYADLRDAKATPSQWTLEQREELEYRGLMIVAKGVSRASCRFMDEWSRQDGRAASILSTAFGVSSDYEANFSILLELRLRQISKLDQGLRKAANKIIADGRGSSTYALNGMRDLFDQAIDLIWRAEGVGADLSVPTSWLAVLSHPEVSNGRIGEIRNRGMQCKILSLVTGSETSRCLTKRISKPTCILMQTIKSAGDHREHFRQAEPNAQIPPDFAIAASLAAVELCQALARELP